VSDTRITMLTNKADNAPVFVLFLLVSGPTKLVHPRVLEVDCDLDEVSAGTVFGLDCHWCVVGVGIYQ
jgi:hypothetical protein